MSHLPREAKSPNNNYHFQSHATTLTGCGSVEIWKTCKNPWQTFFTRTSLIMPRYRPILKHLIKTLPGGDWDTLITHDIRHATVFRNYSTHDTQYFTDSARPKLLRQSNFEYRHLRELPQAPQSEIETVRCRIRILQREAPNEPRCERFKLVLISKSICISWNWHCKVRTKCCF